ncbi:MAG: hypothetical protein QM500_00580 [Methylococcales bacterium]
MLFGRGLPLIKKTEKLAQYVEMNLDQQAAKNIGNVHRDLLARAAAFLLFSDYKALYTIEGEAYFHNN